MAAIERITRRGERPAGRGPYVEHVVDEVHRPDDPCDLCDAARAGVPEQPDESVAWHQSEQARYLGVVEAIHSDGDVCTGIRCGNPEHGWAARAGVPGDEGLKARIDAMYLDGHPMDGYSTERRLGWDEAMATVRSFIRDDAARAGVPGDEGLRAALVTARDGAAEERRVSVGVVAAFHDGRVSAYQHAIDECDRLAASPAPAGLDVDAAILRTAIWNVISTKPHAEHGPGDCDVCDVRRDVVRADAREIAAEYAAITLARDTASPDSEHRPVWIEDVPTGWCSCGEPHGHLASPDSERPA